MAALQRKEVVGPTKVVSSYTDYGLTVVNSLVSRGSVAPSIMLADHGRNSISVAQKFSG